ncbi:MAG: hypothetical protein LBS85_01310 [Clostridiales Family XIII bacterium]|jgi:hypothetical protein|nr:hypothetical protein [Clostridiales Family XIII bacterium]
MVEAAIFFPIAILAAMAVLYLLINVYSQTALQAHMHLFVRAEAASEGERVSVRLEESSPMDRYRAEAESVSIETNEGRRFTARYIEAERSKRYFGGRLANPLGYEMEYYGRCYVIDEAALVRLRELVTG